MPPAGCRNEVSNFPVLAVRTQYFELASLPFYHAVFDIMAALVAALDTDWGLSVSQAQSYSLSLDRKLVGNDAYHIVGISHASACVFYLS